jgi:O-antigen/teichoic acid export membrane protein
MIEFLRRLRNHEVFRNFSYLTIGGILSQAIGLITLIKLARVFSPDNYGLYTFFLVQGQILITIGDLGFTNVIIRSIARDRLRTCEILRAAVGLKAIAVFLLSFAYFGYNALWGHITVNEVLLICMFALLNCVNNLFESILMGNQKMLPISVINISINALWCVIVFLMPDHRVEVGFVFTLFVGLNLIKGLSLYLFLRLKKFIVGPAINFLVASKELLKESWPFLSLSLLMLPINYFSNNFLDINSTDVELGYFNLAQKLMMPVSLVIGFALSAIFPNLSSMWAEDKERFYRIVSEGIKYFIISALVLCFMFTLFAREIVVILFTDEYLPAIQVCQLQIWFVFLMSVNSLIGIIWASTNKEKLILKTAIVNAVISTPLLFYTSRFGALGLSYGYIISFAIFEVYLWIVFVRSENLRKREGLILWTGAIVLFFISYLIPQEMSIVYRLLIFAAFASLAGIYFIKTKGLAFLK